MKTYLVTGAAGFIGTNFVKYMLEKSLELEFKKVNVYVQDVKVMK